jgi:hypothetical protein
MVFRGTVTLFMLVDPQVQAERDVSSRVAEDSRNEHDSNRGHHTHARPARTPPRQRAARRLTPGIVASSPASSSASVRS